MDRSKNRLWDPADAGLCQITLNISEDGADTVTGPVGAPVTVHVAYGSAGRTLFTGIVQRRRLVHDPIQGDQLVLDCVDGFELLSRVNVRADIADSPVGGGETPAQRIARWLIVADWAGDSSLASSTYTCPATVLDGNVLLQIQAATLADGGEFFIDGEGVATFYAWAWRTETGTVDAVFSDRRLHDWVPYSSATLTDDLDEVQNQVSGTRRAVDEDDVPIVQTVENTDSITAYGRRGDPLDNLELSTDEQVADRVTALVAIAGMPSPRFDAIAVQPGFDPSRSWPRVIPCTFGSLVAANRLWEDATEDAFYGHIIGEVWQFTPDDATVTWRVSGTGAWDANAPPRPPVCIERTPEGCLRVCDGYPCNDTDDVIIRDCDGNPIGDPYPPGSLCGEGICELPDDACEVCFENEFGIACVDIQDPRLDALLWFDVLDPGGGLTERIDGDPVDDGPGLADTTLGAIPGGFAAMYATELGGLLGAEHASRLGAADLSDGWTIDFWLYFPAGAEADDVEGTIIDLGTVALTVETIFGTSFGLGVTVIDGLSVTHSTGPFIVPTLDTWQHWVFRWSPGAGAIIVRLGGVFITAEPFTAEPANPAGDWAVFLAGSAAIGEVIVYGQRPLLGDYDATVIADGPYAYWRLGDEELPVDGSVYDGAVTDSGPFAYWKLDEED